MPPQSRSFFESYSDPTGDWLAIFSQIARNSTDWRSL
jgi:hypothetical protein